jgi:hypothetical protein
LIKWSHIYFASPGADNSPVPVVEAE